MIPSKLRSSRCSSRHSNARTRSNRVWGMIRIVDSAYWNGSLISEQRMDQCLFLPFPREIQNWRSPTLYPFFIPYAQNEENKPYTGSDFLSIFTSVLENHVKPSFSVPVENKPYNRPVFQNTADLHLTHWLVRPFKSSCFLPPNLPHPDPINPARTRIWGSFFPGMSENMVLARNKGGRSRSGGEHGGVVRSVRTRRQ